MPLTGHCNCNAITVTIQDEPSGNPHSTVYCHCKTCRRQSGASGTYVIAADENLVSISDPNNSQKTWIDELTDSGKPLKRQFCGHCGCPITSITPLMPGKIIVKMGLFDVVPKAVMECYARNKQEWEPEFGTTKFEGAPGGK